jgi:hypothetical protein
MINLPTAGVDYHVPFGGRKGSSYGPREQGAYAKEFCTQVKTAYISGAYLLNASSRLLETLLDSSNPITWNSAAIPDCSSESRDALLDNGDLPGDC